MLSVVPKLSNPNIINVSGIDMEFEVNKAGSVIGITALDRGVNVWMSTGSYNDKSIDIANIQWSYSSPPTGTGGTGVTGLGWRTSPTDTLQNESLTYLPTASTPTGTVTDGIDYVDIGDEISEFTEHVHRSSSDVLTFNLSSDRIYSYFLYPQRVSSAVVKSIARRTHFMVSGTSSLSIFVSEVDLENECIAWICKSENDDDILYAAVATQRLTITFTGSTGTYSSEPVSITPGYIYSEQVGRYVYFVYRTVTVINPTSFKIGFSYERLNILTNGITSVSMGDVTIPGRVGYFTSINYTYKARLNGGIMLLEWYIADNTEMGVIYVTDSVSKSVQWTNGGGDNIDYYGALGQRAPAGFVGNAGTATHLLGFLNAWSDTQYYCGYAHLDDVGGLTVSLQDVYYDDLDLPGMTNMTNNFITCSSRYVSTPYFIDSQGVDVIILSGLDASVYKTLDPADYDCSALYLSWKYISDSGISGNYNEIGGNTRDDIDDSIFIHGKRLSDGLVCIFGIDEDGNLIKKLDFAAIMLMSDTYAFTSLSSTSNSMMVDTRITKDKNGHYTYKRWVRYIHPLNPDYTR